MTTKILLAAIALGLWANAIGAWSHQARAEDFQEFEQLRLVISYLKDISADTHALSKGRLFGCTNEKICD
jgi:hypothetical protein